jgi:hypothetical protein
MGILFQYVMSIFWGVASIITPNKDSAIIFMVLAIVCYIGGEITRAITKLKEK